MRERDMKIEKGGDRENESQRCTYKKRQGRGEGVREVRQMNNSPEILVKEDKGRKKGFLELISIPLAKYYCSQLCR